MESTIGPRRRNEEAGPSGYADCVPGSLSEFSGGVVVMDPLVAARLKSDGFDTKKKLGEWLAKSFMITAEEYWDTDYVGTFNLPRARKGEEPFASWLKLPKDAMIAPYSYAPDSIKFVVTGGETNAFFRVYDMRYGTSVSIDKWR